jgi:hypothetical protein
MIGDGKEEFADTLVPFSNVMVVAEILIYLLNILLQIYNIKFHLIMSNRRKHAVYIKSYFIIMCLLNFNSRNSTKIHSLHKN